MFYDERDISELVGKTIDRAEVSDDIIDFYLTNGEHYSMFHYQDCCESVEIEDICEDINDVVGSPVLLAEEVRSEDRTPEGVQPPEDFPYGAESYTWTFYKISTVKGSVTIRWFGESNGYYSEEVDFIKVSDG